MNHDPERDKQFVGLCLLCITLVPLALVPLGLAFHFLLRALAPRRARLLVLNAESGRARTFFLGLANTFVLGLLFLVAGHVHAPVVGLIASLLFWSLAFVGSHGLAGALGMKITGAVTVEPRELALGWFVLVYVACLPFLGWTLALYGVCRAIGTTVVSLAQPAQE